MNQHLAVDYFCLICGHLVRKGRRGSSRVRRILVTVPRACYAPIDDSPFSKWTVLVPANIGNRRDLAVVAKDGDSLGSQRYDLRAPFRNVIHGADFDETIPLSSSHSAIDRPPLGARQK